MSGCGWAPESECLIDTFTRTSHEWYENQPVNIWCGLIRRSLHPEPVAIYHPYYTQALTGSVHSGVAPTRAKEAQASRKAAIQRYERHLFPAITWKSESVRGTGRS